MRMFESQEVTNEVVTAERGRCGLRDLPTSEIKVRELCVAPQRALEARLDALLLFSDDSVYCSVVMSSRLPFPLVFYAVLQ